VTSFCNIGHKCLFVNRLCAFGDLARKTWEFRPFSGETDARKGDRAVVAFRLAIENHPRAGQRSSKSLLLTFHWVFWGFSLLSWEFRH
jgi:hypothetical protein